MWKILYVGAHCGKKSQGPVHCCSEESGFFFSPSDGAGNLDRSCEVSNILGNTCKMYFVNIGINQNVIRSVTCGSEHSLQHCVINTEFIQMCEKPDRVFH